MATTVGKSKTRSDVVRGARMGPFSIWTALAGTVVGGVVLAVLVGGTQTILRQNESSIDLSKAWDQAWDELGRRGALVLAGLLFVSYLLTAFVAGRMAWRRGWLHGLAAEIDLRDRNHRREATDERLAPMDGNGHEPAPRASHHEDVTVDIDSLTKEELYEMAQEMDISGRSNMTKEELVRAVRKELRALSKR